MKWMVIIGFAVAVLGGLYRWLVAPAEPDKWGLVDVAIAINGIAGAALCAVGLILLGAREAFRFFSS
jgi:hypothetical protein